jgi:hypothetical protein
MKRTALTPLLIRLLLAYMLLLVPSYLISQESGTCAEKLKSAQSCFEKGLIDTIPSLLTDCLGSGGFKKEEALSAYKLLIQTLLLKDKIQEADSSMYAFLVKYPEYQISPTDHTSFVYLYNSFRVKPVLQVSFHAGLNLPFLTFVKSYPTAGIPSPVTFGSNFGNLYLSLDSKFRITREIEVGFEIGYSQLRFSSSSQYLGFAVSNYEETRQRIEIPAFAIYDFAKFGKFTAYGRLGIGAALNLGTTAIASQVPLDRNNPGSRTGETLKIKDSRRPLDLIGQIGGGLKYKIPHCYVFADVRSNFGMFNQNNHEGKSIPVLDWYYQWTDLDFRLNSLNINVGITYLFYKPSKNKE